MKVLPEIELKLVLYLCLVNQTILSITSDYQREIRLQKRLGMKVEAEVEDDPEVIALAKCSNKYSLKYSGLFLKMPNFSKVKKKLDDCVNEISEQTRDKKFNPLLLFVGGLRHCPFDRVGGFDDIKNINLDSIISTARDEKYLNKWNIQKHALTIKQKFWDA